jgi:DNA polymerase-3 subunit beta
MEFTIDRSDLMQSLGLAQGVVERRNTMPILANVLLEAEGDQLSISATDLEVHLKRTCSAKVKKTGSATVGARKLFELIRELGAGEVTIRSLDNDFVEVTSNRSKVKLVGLAPADFPTFPTGSSKGGTNIELAVESLQKAIDRTLFAVSTDDTRSHLGGVLLTAADGGFRFVGTDGHRLALADVDIGKSDKGSVEKGIILPRKGLAELRKLLDEAEGNANIRLLGNAIRVEQSNVDLVMRLVDGEFPNYEQVVPESTKISVAVDKGEFFAALKRVSVVASDRARGVRLHLEKGLLRVAASSPDFGEASEELAVDYKGAKVEVGFNARYLTDVLGVLPEDQRVTLGLSDETSAGVISTEEDDSYRYVVMPMRL